MTAAGPDYLGIDIAGRSVWTAIALSPNALKKPTQSS